MVTGLTLGKFAPFHRGHQLLVETALAECDEVTCLVYGCPAVTAIPLAPGSSTPPGCPSTGASTGSATRSTAG